jgi:hypothetical protein
MKLPLMVVFLLTFVPAIVSPTAVTQNGQPDQKDAETLDGTYLCEGVRPDGTTYHGTVVIQRHNGAYQLMWSVGREEQYLGLGVLNGDVLAVSYFGGIPGVVAYKVDGGNRARLVGQWTVANADGRLFGETLTRLSRDVTAAPPPERPARRARPLAPGRPT